MTLSVRLILLVGYCFTTVILMGHANDDDTNNGKTEVAGPENKPDPDTKKGVQVDKAHPEDDDEKKEPMSMSDLIKKGKNMVAEGLVDLGRNLMEDEEEGDTEDTDETEEGQKQENEPASKETTEDPQKRGPDVGADNDWRKSMIFLFNRPYMHSHDNQQPVLEDNPATLQYLRNVQQLLCKVNEGLEDVGKRMIDMTFACFMLILTILTCCCTFAAFSMFPTNKSPKPAGPCYRNPAAVAAPKKAVSADTAETLDKKQREEDELLEKVIQRVKKEMQLKETRIDIDHQGGAQADMKSVDKEPVSDQLTKPATQNGQVKGDSVKLPNSRAFPSEGNGCLADSAACPSTHCPMENRSWSSDSDHSATPPLHPGRSFSCPSVTDSQTSLKKSHAYPVPMPIDAGHAKDRFTTGHGDTPQDKDNCRLS